MRTTLGFDTSGFPWLNEPTVADPTSGRDDGTLAWLGRSTLRRACASREFLRYNIAQLPEEWQRKLCEDLQHRWSSAFFELFVARTLQVLGAAELIIERATETGSRPDFLASFGDCEVVVEAKTPELLPEHANDLKQASALRKIVQVMKPHGYSINIRELPQIGPDESKKEFKRALKRLLAVPPPKSADSELCEVEEEISTGLIALTLIPDLANNSTVAGFPAFSGYSDASARIVRAVGRKRPQVGAAKAPVILAIDGGSNATLGDFDRALFGSFRTSVAPDSDVCIHQFCPSGDFAALREGEPTYAGVLAYEQVGFTCPAEPILYLHPRFTGRLPDELRALATRRLVDRNRIEGLPARNPRILANLRPVDWTLDSDES